MSILELLGLKERLPDDYNERKVPIWGGHLVDIDRIREVPWPDDIHINPITYTNSKTGEEVNYISMAADGPNADGETFHHGVMEYLPDYPDRETMLRSAAELAVLVYRSTGHKPLILMTDKDKNQYAGWCMHNDECPEGYGYDKFINEQGR